MRLTEAVLTCEDLGEWKVTLPCSLYSALLDHAVIPDPYVADNAEAISLLSEKSCSFTLTFTLTASELTRHIRRLRIGGIDTVATVFLNKKTVAAVENFHRTYEWEVGELLVVGENTLRIEIASPLTYMAEAQKRHYLWGEEHPMEDGYLHTTSGIGHIRKPAYMFGWDWGPRLPDLGLYGPVELILRDDPLLDEVQIIQMHRNREVILKLHTAPEQMTENLSVHTTLLDPDGNTVDTADGWDSTLTVTAPRLWWPNGYGEQPLYTLVTELLWGDRVVDTDRKEIGLRTLTISREKDKWGREFCFTVNGVKIFGMGACYIPEDSLIPRITPERSERLIADCAKANFNCLRIWGGGFYPSDAFYDLCDRYGILLWQDFMFACLNVRMSERFTENVSAEITEQIRRLRHHACLALFCGNNEMEYGVMYWNWVDRIDELVKRDYLKLYEELIPDLCETLAPQTFYWPSSPSSGGGFFEPGSENDGDVHDWEPWIEGKPMQSYREHLCRFLSEFGFQAFPDLKTIASYTDERDPYTYEMTYHQKRVSSDHAMATYQAQRHRQARTFEQFVYASQVVQGEAIGYAVEANRRERGRCMGTTYWQLNDCWPGQTWSSLDYFGRWKGLHHYAKRFFTRMLLSIHDDGDHVTVNLSSEWQKELRGKLQVNLRDTKIHLLQTVTKEITLAPLSAADVLTLPKSFFGGREREVYLEAKLFDDQGSVIAKCTFLATKPRFFRYEDPSLTAEVRGENGSYTVTVSANAYAGAVMLSSKEYEILAEDNFFDLADGKPYTVAVKSDAPDADTLKTSLTLTSIYDIGRGGPA